MFPLANLMARLGRSNDLVKPILWSSLGYSLWLNLSHGLIFL